MTRIVFTIVFLMPAFLSFAQDFNMKITDEKSGKPMLIGYCTRDAFTDSSFAWWYDSEYENYEVDLESIKPAEGKLDDIYVTIVLGTWCSDSRREVPRFLKILDALDFPPDKLELICVDRQMTGKANEVDGLGIEFVPTIIIYKEDVEIGRIIETPQESLEKDFSAIIEIRD